MKTKVRRIRQIGRMTPEETFRREIFVIGHLVGMTELEKRQMKLQTERHYKLNNNGTN